MSVNAIYKHTPDFLSISRSLRMKSMEWKILLSFDGMLSGEKVRQLHNLEEQVFNGVLHKFINYGLIIEANISLEEYIRQNTDELSGSQHTRQILAEYKNSQPGGVRLASLIDYIEGLAETSSMKQFMVYRVFVKISPELLREEGVESLTDVRSDHIITNPEFIKALQDSFQKTVGKEIPAAILHDHRNDAMKA